MTTLVYRDGVLCGESFCIEDTGENAMVSHRQKVHLSKGKTIAYGLCGYFPDKRFDVFDFIKDMAKAITGGEEPKPIEGCDFFLIVMLKDMVFTMKNDNSGCKFAMLNDDSYIAYGTGSSLANSILVNGGTALDAIQHAMLFDPCSAGDITVVKRTNMRK